MHGKKYKNINDSNEKNKHREHYTLFQRSTQFLRSNPFLEGHLLSTIPPNMEKDIPHTFIQPKKKKKQSFM